MAGFYAARDNTMPPLPWPSIAPPFTPTIRCNGTIPVPVDSLFEGGSCHTSGCALIKRFNRAIVTMVQTLGILYYGALQAVL